MLLREKKYILIMTALLILSIFILILTNQNSGDSSESYKKKANKILVILAGDFSAEVPRIKADKNCDIIEFNAPADISPENWNELAMTIFKMYSDYDAFIILHNPETITYTASALAFMLENLDKTVILTSNLNLAMELAKSYSIPEVIICDGERIIRGCRSKKIKSAINSPNYSYLGKNDEKIELNNEKILSKPKEPLKFLPVDPRKKVIVFKVFPGVDSKYLLGALKEQKIYGIVLESYNSGYAPSDPNFAKIVGEAIKNGIIVVNVSQNMDNVTDRSLENIGVICGRDMTTEAALAKMYLILTNVEGLNQNMARDLMAISMRGEIA
jgi:L-asparaginase/Glu-tRNA(Gln) amidotransferase subunit D